MARSLVEAGLIVEQEASTVRNPAIKPGRCEMNTVDVGREDGCRAEVDSIRFSSGLSADLGIGERDCRRRENVDELQWRYL